MLRKPFFTVAILILAQSGSVSAQDPGIRDTVQFMPRTIGVGISTPVAVRIVNDSSNTTFGYQLVVNSINGGFARCDSIIYSGRMSDPSVMDWRVVNLGRVDGISSDSLTGFGQRLVGNLLPPGNDTLIILYFSGIKPGRFTVDTGSFNGVGGFSFVQKSGAHQYHPVILGATFEVIEVDLPPNFFVTSDPPPIVGNGSDDFRLTVTALSPIGGHVDISLESFTGFDDSLLTPITIPSLTATNPALFRWFPSSSEAGIWLATFKATDQNGLTSFTTSTIQIVSDENSLVNFDISDADSAIQGAGIVHGNMDNDPFPELFMPSIDFRANMTFGLYDLDQSSLREIDRVSNNQPSRGAVLGFINGDDNLDAVISQRGKPTLLPGSGQNSFILNDPPIIDGPTACRIATLADINGDQHLDYVMVRYGLTEVDIFLGTGDGFTLGQQVHTQSIALSINSADFDGDNRDDLAIGTESGVEIHLNNGNGFQLVANYTQEYGSADIEVTNQGSDFNNDNLFDLALATPSVGGTQSELMLYSGNGDGTFEQSRVRLVLGQIFANCAGDFNNDGELDIAYINGSQRYLAILFGNGQGEFPDEVRYVIPKYVPFKLDCLDIDLDGDLDMVVNSFDVGLATSLFLYLNNSDPSGVQQNTLEIMAQNNASIDLTSPSGSRLNRIVKSMPSGEYYRRSLDDNNTLDATAITNTIESGPYTLTASPKKNLPGNDPFTLEYSIDGVKHRLAKNVSMPAGGLSYTIYPDGNSPISPALGEFLDDPQPMFSWPGNGAELFEISTDRNFTNILVSDTVSGGFYVSQTALPSGDSAQYFWRTSALSSGSTGETYVFNIAAVVTDVDEDGNDNLLPGEFALSQNYPNPFNPSTVIEFELPHASMVRLTIHNVLGQLVTTLVNHELPAGKHTVEWTLSDNAGNGTASGIYFYRISAGEFVATKKMVYLR